MIKVFHAKQNIILALAGIVAGQEYVSVAKDHPAEYSYVAQVESTELEAARQLTTHVDKNWWDNDCVQSEESIGMTCNARSTAPGDVLVQDSEAFVVTVAGFEKLPQEVAFRYVAT